MEQAARTQTPQAAEAPVSGDAATPGIVARLMLRMIRGYQMFSRHFPPTCRFSPSCSEYTAQAIAKHGPLRGVLLGTGRICRCQPFCKGGHDPVP